jgi:hypothetical protein
MIKEIYKYLPRYPYKLFILRHESVTGFKIIPLHYLRMCLYLMLSQIPKQQNTLILTNLQEN